MRCPAVVPSPRLPMPLSRRSFCSLAAASLASRPLLGQPDHATARPDVAAIDRDRILNPADALLTAPVETLMQATAPLAGGEAQIGANDLVVEDGTAGSAQLARGAALLHFTGAVPTLAAASYLLQPEDATRATAYARRAALWLDAWLAMPATRMTPTFAVARLASDTHLPQPSGVAEGAALGEVAKAIPFLLSTGAVAEAQLNAWKQWFRELASWLDTARLAGLARDSKDHTGSAWLLLRVSCAALLNDEAGLASLRHRFRSVTLRAEIRGDGTFPHELTSETPYRNSLFNLDMLAACADLLSTHFESAWEYELQDGPGMRAAIARHVPWIANRGAWPYPADPQLFTQLPARRPAL